jgi:hypothetical protein
MTLLQGRSLHLHEYMGMLPGKMLFEQIGPAMQGNLPANNNYHDFLNGIKPLEYLSITNSIPRVYLAEFQDIAFFYLFYTAKTIAGDPYFQNTAFSLNHPSKNSYLEKIKPFTDKLYNKPSTEILWVDAIDCLLKPILYYWETKQIEGQDTVARLLQQLKEFINHLEKMAVAGRKFRHGEAYGNYNPAVHFYVTEIPLQESTVIFTTEKGPLVAHILNGLSVISTSNAYYCKEVQAIVQSILEKSTNLTTSGEKLRLQFFNSQRQKLEDALQAVGAS